LLLAAAVNSILVAGENLRVGSSVWLPAESIAPGRCDWRLELGAERNILAAEMACWSAHRVLICDRDRKWSEDVLQLLADAGVQVVRTPFLFC
jgi:hypothetical protein